MKIIVTGSRDYRDSDYLIEVLSRWQPRFISVGDCPTGADCYANGFIRSRGIASRVYKADWKRFGKSAGPIRNQEMVDEGADMVLAFFQRPDSKGTLNCVKLAEAAGIPVTRYGNF